MMFFGGWMMIVWIIIIGLIVWGVVALTTHAGGSPSGGERRNPLDIARERYARGEISREEFDRIKKDLM
jgi:putative membrane protein